MTPADAHFARIVLSFIDGTLDHCDERTRGDLAVALFRLDYASARTSTARALHDRETWYDLLGLISFDPEPVEPDLFTEAES